MMRKSLLVATICTAAVGANAGDWGKAPVGKAPIEECVDLGGEISVGYTTDYFFNGYHVGEDSVWADVNYTFDGLAVPITLGVWYLNSFQTIFGDPEFDHLKVYASAGLGTVAGFDLSISYTQHWFPEASNQIESFGEIGLQARRSFGFVDFVASTSYFTGEENDGAFDWNHHLGLEKTIGLTDNISLVLAGGAGYADRFVYFESGWHHYYVKASLPIQLNCRTVLTPFVGYHFDQSNELFPGVVLPFEDKLFSGVSLSVSF